jgi:hypothetical protein
VGRAIAADTLADSRTSEHAAIRHAAAIVSSSLLTLLPCSANILRVVMDAKRYSGYFWFSYFAVGKESLLAHGFTTTSR